jgi:hypothetical protein
MLHAVSGTIDPPGHHESFLVLELHAVLTPARSDRRHRASTLAVVDRRLVIRDDAIADLKLRLAA